MNNELELIRKHIQVLNDETGQLRDYQFKMSEDIGVIKVSQATMSNDIDWLKKFLFIVATASIGGLIAGVLNLIYR